MRAHTANLLIVLVPLADNRNHIAGFRLLHRMEDGLSPVRNLDESASGLYNALANIGNDVLDLLIAGIIRRYD